MEIGIPRYCRLLAPLALIGGLVSPALLATSPPGHAACPPGEMQDTVTGMCWTQLPATNGGVGVGPCEPGMGVCMGTISIFPNTDYIPPPASDRVNH